MSKKEVLLKKIKIKFKKNPSFETFSTMKDQV
jgi:hypothetical protein